MTLTDNGVAGYLPADDPNYRQFQAASQFEPSPIARQFAAMLVGTCPHGLRHDPAACAAHLQGVAAAHGFTDLIDEGRRRAEPHIAAADESLDAMIEANAELEEAAHDRRVLPDEVVDAHPNRGSRSEIRRQLSQNQRIVAHRELVGDFEHRRKGDPGWPGWVVAIIVGVLETVVTVRIFNVDLTHFYFLSFLPWAALTIGLVFFNHQVAAYLGEKRRIAREVHDAATRLNTTALHRIHRESSVAQMTPLVADNHDRAAQVAGLAPSAERVRRANRARSLALAIYGIPLILLMTGMYLRLFSDSTRLGLGLFDYVYPLIVVAVLAALLWALVVEPYSRGNALGDHLRSQEQVDQDTIERDSDLLNTGRLAAQEARQRADEGRSALMSAEQEIADMAAIGHRALQIAHSAMGVATIGAIRTENMIAQPFPHLDRIASGIHAELDRTARGRSALEACVMSPLDSLDSPHLVYETPPTVVPDLGFVVPETMAPYADSTLGFDESLVARDDSPSRVRRIAVAAAIATLVVGGAAFWYFTHTPSEAVAGTVATAAPSVSSKGSTPPVPSPETAGQPESWPREAIPVPAGLAEGQDFSFGTTTADGSPARWSCTTPVTVRLAGDAPAGADQALAEAVEAVRGASDLPLEVGSSVAGSVSDSTLVPANEILVNYLTPEQISAAGLDITGETLGQGGVRAYEHGGVTTGWVGIRTDEPATDPATTTGREVLWHELAHAVNLGHSQQVMASPEIMAPTMEPGQPVAWGPGDLYALASVGCSPALAG